MDYLIERYRKAREELMYRVKARDTIIKLQLLVQAILIGMSEGVKLGGVEVKEAMPYITFLSVPISLIFWLLYFTEDRLIGQIALYNRRLFRDAFKNGQTQHPVDCWDGSAELMEYLKIRTFTRFFINLMVFFLIPGILLFIYYTSVSTWSCSKVFTCILENLGLLLILGLILLDFIFRITRRGDMMKDKD